MPVGRYGKSDGLKATKSTQTSRVIDVGLVGTPTIHPEKLRLSNQAKGRGMMAWTGGRSRGGRRRHLHGGRSGCQPIGLAATGGSRRLRRRGLRGVLLSASCLVLAIATSACGSTHPQATSASQGAAGKGPIQLDFMTSETGPLAGSETPVIKATQIAVSMWNSTHSLKAHLNICDTGGTAQQTAACVARFQGSGILLGPTLAPDWTAAEPALESSGQLEITGCAPCNPPGTSRLFAAVTPEHIAQQQVMAALKQAGLDSLGLLVTDSPTSLPALHSSIGLAKAAGIHLTTAEISPTATSAVGALSSLGHPQAIEIWSVGSAGVTALRGLQSLGELNLPVIMNYANTEPSTYQLAGGAVPKHLYLIGAVGLLPNALPAGAMRTRVTDFVSRFEKATGSVPGWLEYVGPDQVWMAMTAASHSTSVSGMVSYLQSGVAIPAFTVPSYRFTASDHQGNNVASSIRFVRLASNGRSWTSATP